MVIENHVNHDVFFSSNCCCYFFVIAKLAQIICLTFGLIRGIHGYKYIAIVNGFINQLMNPPFPRCDG